MNRNRLCLWLALTAIACSKLGTDPVPPSAPPVEHMEEDF